MTEKNIILVVGDVMIDRTWLIPSISIKSSSQAHAEIEPFKLIKPGKRTDMLGGAATVARRILSSEHNFKTILIGGWNNELNNSLEENPFTLIPEIKENDKNILKRIEFFRSVPTKFDTIKWRIFSAKQGKIDYINRYDRDFESDDYLWNLEDDYNDWPTPKNTAAVIVADFAKGLLDSKRIKNKLKDYNECPFLLRTKQSSKKLEEILTELPWTVLLPNREDLARFLNSRDLRPKALKILPGGHIAINPYILKTFEKLIKNLSNLKITHLNDRDIFLKLDYEGGILLTKNETICPIALKSIDTHKNLAGIGSGDVLMAELAMNLIKTPHKMNNKYEIYNKAVRQATIYTINAKEILHNNWYGRFLGFIDDGLNDYNEDLDIQPVIEKEPKNLITLIDNWNKASKDLNIEDTKEIDLYQADWYLENYITTKENFGPHLEYLREQFANYLKNPDKKPLVVAICGEPGVGKSYLAKRYSEIIGCDFIAGNAAQWTSYDDFFMICERIRSLKIISKGKPPLVFLDEIDSKIGSEHIYGKLLAPLWDGIYIKNGEQREIGSAIFLLAGSDKYWKSEATLMDNKARAGMERPEKLNDLVSRLSFKPISIEEIDTVYVVVDLIKKRFPKMTKIERATLYKLCSLTPRYGVRSLREAIKQLHMVEIDGMVLLKKEKEEENGNILEMHFEISKIKKEFNENDFIEVKTQS